MLLVLGLALDDMRQFIARQQALALRLVRRQAGAEPPKLAVSPLGICAAAAVCGCGGINLEAGNPAQPTWYLIGFSLLGLTIPAYSLSRQWETAIACWKLAAQEQNFFRIRLPRRVIILTAVPALWMLVMGAMALTDDQALLQRLGQSEWHRLSVFLGIGGVFAALGLFMLRACQWRIYQEFVLASIQPHAPRLRAWRDALPTLLFWIATGLALLAAFTQLEQIITPGRLNFMSTRDVIRMLTSVTGTYYIFLWLTAAPLQFLMLERALPEPAD